MSSAVLPAASQVEREAYEDAMWEAYKAADTATHGYMVNERAQRKGIRSEDLYLPHKGRAHPGCASDELKAAWDHGQAPRPMSWAQFQRHNGHDTEQEPEDMPEELVDLKALAALAGITHNSARQAKWKGRLPEPDYVIGGHPAWRMRTVKRWLDKRNGVTTPRRPPVVDPDAWIWS